MEEVGPPRVTGEVTGCGVQTKPGLRAKERGVAGTMGHGRAAPDGRSKRLSRSGAHCRVG